VQSRVNAGTTGRGIQLVSLRVRGPYCGKFDKAVQNRVNAGTTGRGTQLVNLRARVTYCREFEKLCKIGLTQVSWEKERSW
jgi:hypothetical protein